MPTLRDVAARAGVSIGLASAAVNGTGSVSADARARVLDAVRALDYVPHAGARDLRRGHGRLIGLVVPDITNPHFAGLADAIGVACEAEGYALTLSITGDDPARELRHLALLRTQRAAGIILVPGAHAEANGSGIAAALYGPVVLLDRRVPGLAADTVLLDNRAATFALTEHLLALGHRRIGLLAGPAVIELARERLDGFRRAHASRSCRPDATLIVSGSFQPEPAFRATLALLAHDRPPTALLSTSNHLTTGMMRALSQRGLRWPDDVSVVGVDDLPGADGFAPGLTVAAQPVDAMGRDAARFLLDRLADGRLPARVSMHAPQLRIRGSTGPVQNGARSSAAGRRVRSQVSVSTRP